MGKRKPVLAPGEQTSLEGFLRKNAAVDLDGLLGIFHAAAVGPSPLPPSVWLPLLLPQGFESLDQSGAESILGALMRVSNDVADRVDREQLEVPPPQEPERCASFARGFFAAAKASPVWTADPEAWAYVDWAAFLAGEREVAPAPFDERPSEEQAALVRAQIGSFIVNAYRDNVTVRLPSRLPPPPAKSRVGRNDPCPCGSGKKYKRCCGR